MPYNFEADAQAPMARQDRSVIEEAELKHAMATLLDAIPHGGEMLARAVLLVYEVGMSHGIALAGQVLTSQEVRQARLESILAAGGVR